MTKGLRTTMSVLVLPLLIGLAGALLARSWVNDLPDPVATHWGLRGVDGFTARDTAVVMLPLVGTGAALVIGGLLWIAARRAPLMRRAAGGLACGMATFLTTLTTGTLWVQRGLADARSAPSIDGAIAIALVLGLVLGGLGAVLTPGAVPGAARALEPVPATAPRAVLGEDQSADWLAWAKVSTGLYVVFALAMIPMLGLVIVATARLALLMILGLVVLAVASMTTFQVIVGSSGLHVRSITGFPRFHVPLEEVAEAAVIDVRPLRDFGGWGLRGNFSGAFGVVQRAGEAIEVRRGDNSTFVVTVDGAPDAVALLNSLADRERASRATPEA